MERRVVTISWTALWRVFLFILVAAVLFAARDLILALFFALVVSSGIDVVIDFLERRGVPRTLGVILIFLAGAVLLALLVYFIIPSIIVDFSEIMSGTGQQALIGKVLDPLRNTAAGQSFSNALNRLANDYFSQAGSPLGFVSQALGGVLLGATVLISSFYLSLTNDGVDRLIRAVFPAHVEERVLKIYRRARRKVGLWFQTQLLLSLIMWLLVWIALTALGVKHAFVLGLIAGVFELLPFVGPIVSGALAVMVALTASPSLALYTLIAFLCIQQFEAHFLVPLVTKKAVDIHPVIVIIAILIGVELNGILGALVAVPLAGVIQEIVEARGEESERERESAVI